MHSAEWHGEMLKRIDNVTSKLDKRTANRFRADLLKRIATRLVQYSAEGCSECDTLKGHVSKLVELYEQAARGQSVDLKEHKALLLELIKHLRSKHKLIEEGTNQTMWMSIGLAMGVALQSTIGPSAIGIGLCLGVAVGTSFDASAKKAGKML